MNSILLGLAILGGVLTALLGKAWIKGRRSGLEIDEAEARDAYHKAQAEERRAHSEATAKARETFRSGSARKILDGLERDGKRFDKGDK